MPTKTQRWLDLITVLVGHRYPVPFRRIVEQVPAYRDDWDPEDRKSVNRVRRKFERDKQDLRALGIPIETRAMARSDSGSTDDGYVLQRGDLYLPYLDLLPGGEPGASRGSGTLHDVGKSTVQRAEVETAVSALRAALTLPSFPFQADARRALGKLTFDLEPLLRGDAGGPAVRLLDRPGGADPNDCLGLLLEALELRSRVSFRYRSMSREGEVDRMGEPWGLFFKWGAWYLVARDPESQGVRLFRIDRMSEAVMANRDRSPDFEVPADFDIRAFVSRDPWELGGGEVETRVAVHFDGPALLLAERNGWGEEQDEDEPGVRYFQVRRMEPFCRWILSMAGEARIVSPDSAVAAIRKAALAVAGGHIEKSSVEQGRPSA
jgi:proteasome accessory factor B